MNAEIRFARPEPLHLAFSAPCRTLVAMTVEDVRPLLDAVHDEARRGRWCVGFVRYEAAPAFDAAFEVHAADGPLAWFGVYETAQAPADAPGEAAIDWQDGPDRAAFDAAIAEIHRAIADGEVYQVNHTARQRGAFHGDPRALFAALRRSQPESYAAFIDTGGEQVLTVSPELFFDWRDGVILSRPMKGTAARGATPDDDARAAEALCGSVKERAENVMIVDLIRNDISRIAELFSVTVPRLFHTEPLPTVWQMTSDVQALTRPGTTLADVFGALFPCGSVTGAPKVQAMRAIRTLEPDARGVYCGAIGVVRPGGHATFNVAIRTVTLKDGAAACGIGSGITADAGADGEWREWRLKRAFAERASRPFELLETLRLEDGEACDAAAHLARMARGAAQFGFACNAAAARRALDDMAQRYPDGVWRVRLLLDAAGRVQADAQPMAPPQAGPVTVQLAAAPLDEADHSEFVRFKTTRRGHYERFAPADPRVFDTLLWNARGEITEFTRGNVALRIDGRWVTPPLACGLLDGVARARALREGRLAEAVVRVEELRRVQNLAFVNSLRGWLDARLAAP